MSTNDLATDMADMRVTQKNAVWEGLFPLVFLGVATLIVLLGVLMGVVLYQLKHKPWPIFSATSPAGQQMPLTAFQDPNMLPDTIMRFASDAALAVYTFNFVNFDKQLGLGKRYFTSGGWSDFRNSITGTISTIVENQLFVSGVVTGQPVISNQGPLPGVDYAWRVQIPFLVTYQSANSERKYYSHMLITVVRVPTTEISQGMGVDQFIVRS